MYEKSTHHFVVPILVRLHFFRVRRDGVCLGIYKNLTAMNKKQYRAFLRAQKQVRKPPKKLIHLLINYRSKRAERYPYEFIHMMRFVKQGNKDWNYDALYYFLRCEGSLFNQPSFATKYSWNKVCYARETEIEIDLPF